LVVDDLVDTGDTMVVAMAHLAGKGAAEIRTAVMQSKKGAEFHPDFVARKIVRWRWVIYPWAVLEDLAGFLRRKGVVPQSTEELGDYFFREYGVKISGAVRADVLAMLARSEKE
jgi:hypoxanthine phosphoribosyltransferase